MTDVTTDKPTFNFPQVSWGESKRFAIFQARLRKLGREDCSAEETGAIFDELGQMMARYVTSVPREWLMPDAPADLDWSDPASFDWIVSERMSDLQRAMNKAKTPQEVSGN